MKNTTVTGNTAKTSGGGIYIAGGSVFTMSDSSVITVVPMGEPSKNDVYLTDDAYITLTGALTADSKIARITLNSSGNGYFEYRAIVKSGSGFTIPPDYNSKFEITDKINNPKKWELIFQSNTLKLKKKS